MSSNIDPKRVPESALEASQTRSEAPQPIQMRDATQPVSSKFFSSGARPSGSGHSSKDPLVLVPPSSSPDTSPPNSAASLTYTPKMGHHPPSNGNPASSIYKGRMMQDERLKTKVPKLLSAANQLSSDPTSATTSATSSRSSSVRRGREDDDSSSTAPPRKKLNTGLTSDKSDAPDVVQAVGNGVKHIDIHSSQPSTKDVTMSDLSPSPQKPRGRLVRGRQATVTQESSSSVANSESASTATTRPTYAAQPSASASINQMRDELRREAMASGTTGTFPTTANPALAPPRPMASSTRPINYLNIPTRAPGAGRGAVPAPVGSYAFVSRPGGPVPYYPVPTSAAYQIPQPPVSNYRPITNMPTGPTGRGAGWSVPKPSSKPKPQPKPVPATAPTPASASKGKLLSSKPSAKSKRDYDSDGVSSAGAESDDGWSGDEDSPQAQAARAYRTNKALEWFETATPEELIEVTAITPAQASSILSLRPFEDEDDLRSKFQKQKGISPRYFDDYIRMLEGYDSVDKVIEKCEKVGKDLSDIISVWTASADASADSSKGESDEKLPSTGAGASPMGVDLVAVAINPADAASDAKRAEALKDYMNEQPKMLAEGVKLKDYQLTGINWLSLLYKKELSCILADEMGLGKTIQVIAFLASLKEKASPDAKSTHLVIVPSSTLENWGREFGRFAPSLNIETYYGTQNDRIAQRAHFGKDIEEGSIDVLITTYNLAQGTEHDRKFFRKHNWNCVVFDEGHVLKNFQSQRYNHLLRIPSHWRLLLTGTPLQNNLQELVSLMNFLLPDYFADALESLRAIFKVTANSHTSFLSESRVKRASKMLTPFVLRRRKDQVLKDLPKKTERIEWCELTTMQRSIYNDALKRSRKVLEELPKDEKGLLEATEEKEKKKPGRPKKGVLVSSGANSSNILMDLRKASLHPMLFRRLFDDDKVNLMARHCLSEPEFSASNFDLVVEDMQVMNDAELQWFCNTYKSCKKHALEDNIFLESGKIGRLLALLKEYQNENKRVLIFSQFTQILEILKVILEHQGVRFVVLTGATPVNERQNLVDEFNEDENIPVFLLSTRAGGMGINLTAACVVIIFDQDFNPHNDKQAMDRAYRIGQRRDVEVVKLITKGTIEENILRLGQVKLVLDQAVTAGEGNEDEESTTEKTMKASLLSELRKQFEQEEGDKEKITEITA